jgi:hypothetical protein
MKISNIIAYPDFKQSWKEIKQEKGKYLFLFLQIIVFSDMLKIGRSDMLLIANMCVSFLLAVYFNRIQTQKIFAIFGIYVLICIPPIVMWGIDELLLNQYIGYGIRVLTACFIANYFRDDFIRYFENLVFFLTYTSIVLFIIQLINPHIYDVFTPLSRLIMEGRQYYQGERGITMHQYLLVYVVNGWAIHRNSGFMWEPAAYGAMLTWALIFNLYMNRFRFNKKMGVFLIAVFTTFSLGTYSYLTIIVSMFILQSFSIKKTFPLILTLLVAFVLLTQTELLNEQYSMMTEKTEKYSDVDGALQGIEKGVVRTNRVASVYANLFKLKEAPFGFGMVTSNYMDSANGLVNFLMKWGISGALVLVISFKLFADYLRTTYYRTTNKIVLWLTVIVFIFPIFGNPFFNQVFFVSFLLLPYFFRKPRKNIS